MGTSAHICSWSGERGSHQGFKEHGKRGLGNINGRFQFLFTKWLLWASSLLKMGMMLGLWGNSLLVVIWGDVSKQTMPNTSVCNGRLSPLWSGASQRGRLWGRECPGQSAQISAVCTVPHTVVSGEPPRLVKDASVWEKSKFSSRA